MILEKDKVDWFTAMLHIMGREKGIQYMRELSKQNPMLRIGQTLITQLVAAGESTLAGQRQCRNRQPAETKGRAD